MTTIGPSAASFHLAEPLPAATVAPPGGTSFSTGFDPNAGGSPDDSASVMLSAWDALSKGQAANATSLGSAREPVVTAIRAARGNAAHRGDLAVENARLTQEIAGLQQQLAPLQTELDQAKTDLAGLDPSDPANQTQIAADQTQIAADQANIDAIQQSLQQAQSRSTSNTAQITSLGATALDGFRAIEGVVARRLSAARQEAATLDQTTTDAFATIYALLQDFRNTARNIANQSQVEQREADGRVILTRKVAGKVAAARQTEAAAPTPSSPSNPAASSRRPDRAGLSPAPPNQIAPAVAAPPPAQTAAEVPAPPVEDSADQENEKQADIAATDLSAENAAAPAATEDPPRDPPALDNNTSSTERAAVQESGARGTAARDDNDKSLAALADMRAELLKQADRLIARLDRLVNQVNPSRPSLPLDSQQKLTSLLDLESPLVRRKILV